MATGRFTDLVVSTGLTGSLVGTTLTIAAAAAPTPASDTLVWMPLTTTVAGDDVLVFDASHQLIPTLTPI